MITKACAECREPWEFATQLVLTEDGPAHLRECGTCGAIASLVPLTEGYRRMSVLSETTVPVMPAA
jgi:uncharacterized Zn finger protein